MPDIAVGYARIGQREKAQQLLSQASAVADANFSQFKNNYVLPDFDAIAVGYAEIGDYDKALGQIESMKNAAQRQGELSDIDAEIALYRTIYQALQAEDFDQAIQLSQKLNPSIVASDTEIVVPDAKTVVLLDTETKYSKAQALLDIADGAVKALNDDQSKAVLNRLLSTADSLPNVQEQVKVVIGLAVNYYQIDLTAIAEERLSNAEQLDIQALGLPASINIEIAQGYAQIGRTTKAEQLLDRAYQQNSQWLVSLPKFFPNQHLYKLVVSYAQLSQTTKATDILGEMAKAVGANSVDPVDRMSGIDSLAETYITVGEYDKALQALKQKYQWYPLTDAQNARPVNGYERGTPEAKLAVEYAKLGKNNKALSVARMARSKGQRAAAFNEITTVYAEQGKYEQALKIADLLEIKSAYSSELGFQSRFVANIIEVVAQQAEQAESDARAREVLDMALKRAESIGIAEHKIAVLSALSIQYAAVGQPEKAADLLSQSLKLIED